MLEVVIFPDFQLSVRKYITKTSSSRTSYQRLKLLEHARGGHPHLTRQASFLISPEFVIVMLKCEATFTWLAYKL